MKVNLILLRRRWLHDFELRKSFFSIFLIKWCTQDQEKFGQLWKRTALLSRINCTKFYTNDEDCCWKLIATLISITSLNREFPSGRALITFESQDSWFTDTSSIHLFAISSNRTERMAVTGCFGGKEWQKTCLIKKVAAIFRLNCFLGLTTHKWGMCQACHNIFYPPYILILTKASRDSVCHHYFLKTPKVSLTPITKNASNSRSTEAFGRYPVTMLLVHTFYAVVEDILVSLSICLWRWGQKCCSSRRRWGWSWTLESPSWCNWWVKWIIIGNHDNRSCNNSPRRRRIFTVRIERSIFIATALVLGRGFCRRKGWQGEKNIKNCNWVSCWIMFLFIHILPWILVEIHWHQRQKKYMVIHKDKREMRP